MGINRFNAEGYPDPTAYEALRTIEKQEKSYKPLVYIASPFAGDIEGNSERAREYCKFAVKKGAIPIAPHLHYPQFLDDSDSEQRGIALRFALILLGKCEELWVFGDAVSAGMSREIAKAQRKGMPIKFFNDEEVSIDGI
jgi:hypothetical protein